MISPLVQTHLQVNKNWLNLVTLILSETSDMNLPCHPANKYLIIIHLARPVSSTLGFSLVCAGVGSSIPRF
jgi:hypothetical protein